MVVPLVVAIIGAISGAAVLALLLGGAGAFAIVSNATVIAYIIGGIVGLFIIRTLFR